MPNNFTRPTEEDLVIRDQVNKIAVLANEKQIDLANKQCFELTQSYFQYGKFYESDRDVLENNTANFFTYK